MVGFGYSSELVRVAGVRIVGVKPLSQQPVNSLDGVHRRVGADLQHFVMINERSTAHVSSFDGRHGFVNGKNVQFPLALSVVPAKLGSYGSRTGGLAPWSGHLKRRGQVFVPPDVPDAGVQAVMHKRDPP